MPFVEAESLGVINHYYSLQLFYCADVLQLTKGTGHFVN